MKYLFTYFVHFSDGLFVCFLLILGSLYLEGSYSFEWYKLHIFTSVWHFFSFVLHVQVVCLFLKSGLICLLFYGFWTLSHRMAFLLHFFYFSFRHPLMFSLSILYSCSCTYSLIYFKFIRHMVWDRDTVCFFFPPGGFSLSNIIYWITHLSPLILDVTFIKY